MSIQNTLQTTLAPCKALSDLAVKQNNSNSATTYKTIETLMNSIIPAKDRSTFDSSGSLYLAECTYHFFAKDYFSMSKFREQIDELKASKLALKHQMKHLNVSDNTQAKLLQTMDRHLSVLDDFRNLSFEAFASKTLITTGILAATVLPLSFSNPSFQKIPPIIIGANGAAFCLDSTSRKHSIDYTPYSSFENKIPSVRERLIQNHNTIKELNV